MPQNIPIGGMKLTLRSWILIVLIVLNLTAAGILFYRTSAVGDITGAITRRIDVLDQPAVFEVTGTDEISGQDPSVNSQYHEIGTVAEAGSCDAEGPGYLFEDYEGDLRAYLLEKEDSRMEASVDTGGICGRHLRISYSHGTGAGFHTARLNYPGTHDWSQFSYVSFLFMAEKDTRLLAFVIEDRDRNSVIGDFWWFVNMRLLEGNKWYLVTVPLKDMYPVEGHPIGNGKQDYDDINRAMFAFEAGPESNVVHIDNIYLH
ncbi:MAG: carbohydrate binding domain-containing protein [archaeon]